MSKRSKAKTWYDVPPVDLVDKLNKDESLCKEVVSDLLDLYKRDKKLTMGIINQIDLYAKMLLLNETIERISITESEVGYFINYSSDVTDPDNGVTMELCIEHNPEILSIGN